MAKEPDEIDPSTLTPEEILHHYKNLRRSVVDAVNYRLIGPYDARPRPYIPGLLNIGAELENKNLGRQFRK